MSSTQKCHQHLPTRAFCYLAFQSHLTISVIDIITLIPQHSSCKYKNFFIIATASVDSTPTPARSRSSRFNVLSRGTMLHIRSVTYQ
ncbi:hypothetical protein PM082_022390 [Marasmius tenuissimus]|nr:hypothetical protein PM082_022390 [Marasmius tenuissimus]